MYVSDHPIARALDGLDLTGVTPLSQLGTELVGQVLTIIGMLTNVRRLATKKGDSMLVAVLEDLEASAELVAFPKSYEKHRELLLDDALLRVRAKADERNGTIQLLLEGAEALEAVERRIAPEVEMDLEGLEEYIPAGAADGAVAPQDDIPHPAGPGSTEAKRQPTSEAAPAGEPVPSQPISIIRSRTKVGTNGNGGNGNGGGNGGNGNGGGSSSGYGGGAPATPTHLLRLFLPRSHDFDADVLKMQMVDRVLRESTGEDQVIIHLPNAVGMVLLKPRHKIRCTNELVGALQEVLGVEGVAME
jgi:DNA polymerase III subunit alpha